MLERLLAAILTHPRATAGGWAVALVLGVLGAVQLNVDFSSTAFYADEAKAVSTLREFSERWGPDDRSLAVVASRGGGSMLGPKTRSELLELADRLEKLDAVERVIGIHAFGPAPLEILRSTDAVPALLNESGTATVLLVELRESTDDPRVAVAAMADVNAVLTDFGASTDIALEPAGIPATRAAFIELAVRDQMVLGPLAAGLAGLVLLVAWRRPSLVLVAGAGAGIPVLLLLGAMGWTGEPVGLLNQAYFTLLPVIALADAVHLVTRANRMHQQDPDRPLALSIRAAGTRVGWACLLTTVTTALGFASLATTSLPMLQRFGLYAAVGIVFAYASVVTLVPVLLLWSGLDPRRKRSTGVPRALARICVRHPWATLAVAFTLCIAALGPASTVEVDNHLSHLLEPNHPVRRASEFVDRELGGTLSIEVELAAPPGRSFGREELASGVQRLRDEVSDPAVRTILGPADAGPTAEYVTADRSFARLSIRTQDIGGAAFASLLDRTRAAVILAFPEAQIVVTGSAAVAYDGVNHMTDELRRSLLGLLLLVTVLIALLLRSGAMGARSILPNVIPLWLGYAAVGLVGLELDPIATVVLALALGIAVDDTIHIMVVFRERRAEGIPVREAAIGAAEASGEAVVLTSLCLAVGLATNTLSSFPPLAVLGWLGSSVIMLAMLADLTVLPALLVLGAAEPVPTIEPLPHKGSELG